MGNFTRDIFDPYNFSYRLHRSRDIPEKLILGAGMWIFRGEASAQFWQILHIMLWRTPWPSTLCKRTFSLNLFRQTRRFVLIWLDYISSKRKQQKKRHFIVCVNFFGRKIGSRSERKTRDFGLVERIPFCPLLESHKVELSLFWSFSLLCTRL